ncbi:carbamoyl phosphate synthase small subunit, partial [Candidatus Uhrbacteria bacterium]|nr:carbamoyl phosphate synthase small subunit [Candidatus Uhrbacteria bacterium]
MPVVWYNVGELPAYLVLSDGAVYEGKPLGAAADAIGEVVFNTGMTGYQEILSDPSYAGQIVLFTYPLIGNYGINEDDFESACVRPRGIIVREACELPSNWRSSKTLDAFLKETDTPGIQGIDTRALTKRIRSAGVTMGIITSEDPERALAALRAAKSYGEIDFVQEVTTKAPYAWGPSGMEPVDEPSEQMPHRVVVLDCGLKYNILRRLVALGVRPIVLPATTPADEVLGWKPDG